LVLIDGNSLLHRAYHAMPKLTTSSGKAINAVYGFVSMLFRVFVDLAPDYVAVSFDKKGPTFRHKEFAEYKAKRPKMEEDLVSQVEPVHEVVESLNIPIFEIDGYEADDVLGTLAKQAGKRGVEAVIVTGDRDALQLVDDKTKVYCPIKGLSNPVLYDGKKVFEKYGFEPEKLIEFKALRGDPSDNIPGVGGVGEVTAKDLISRFGDLEGIYKNIDEVKKGVAEKLIKDKEQAYLSRRLGEIVINVPIKLKLIDCKLGDYDRGKAAKVFEKYEFKSLLKRLPEDIEDLKRGKVKKKKVKKRTLIKSGREKKENENQLGLF